MREMNERRLRAMDRGHDSGAIIGPDMEWIRGTEVEMRSRMGLWKWFLIGVSIVLLVWMMSLADKSKSMDPGLPTCGRTAQTSGTRCG